MLWRIKLPLAIGLLALPAVAQAEQWMLGKRAWGPPGARRMYLVDRASVHVAGDGLTVFTTAELNERPVKGVAYRVVTNTLSCKARTFSFIHMAVFDRTGKLLIEGNPPPMPSVPVTPGTPTALYRAAVCDKVWSGFLPTKGNAPPAIRTALFARKRTR